MRRTELRGERRLQREKRVKSKQTQVKPRAMRGARLLSAVLILNLIFALCLIISRFDASQAQTAKGEYLSLESGWTVFEDGGTGEEGRELPILADGDTKLLVLERGLEDGGSGLYLNLKLLNAAVRVYVDDELCYENGYLYLRDGDEQNEVVAVFGSERDTVELPEFEDGARLRLELQSPGGARTFGVNSALLSREDSVVNSRFRLSLTAFLCTVVACSGILVLFVLHLIGVCSSSKSRMHLTCTLFGLFLALHAASQIDILQMIYGNRSFFLWVAALSLSLLPPTLVSFYRELFREGRGTRFLIALAFVNYVVALLEGAALLVMGAWGLSYIRKASFFMFAVSVLAVLVVFFVRRECKTAASRVRMLSLALLLADLALETRRLFVGGNSDSFSSRWLVVLTLYFTITSIVGVVTELANHTRVIRASEQKAIAANKAKSAFLANMSHEIRTPINAILGMDEMILRESAESATLSYAEDIESAGRTLLSLINDILDFSKVEEGKMEILPTQYDLSSVINDLTNMIRPRARDKGLRFDVRTDETTPHLLIGDEIRIRQCALNVLTNAVKYTESGSVTLYIGYEKLSEDKISLRMRVTDTGIGMKPEDMERLFSPFTRIEEERNRAIEGTGLGMSITKQLLTLMGSTLEVQSDYGKGSTFSFAIEQDVVKWDGIGRLTFEHGGGRSRGAYREMFRAPDARILVVDDTPVNLAVIRGLLKRTKVQVDTAESGAEALRKAPTGDYDVILLDHMMPKMDGLETLRELRKLPGMDKIPCIALTANAISGAREMYLEAGFTDYLSKPVDGAKLEKALMRALPKEKLFEPAPASPVLPPTPGVPRVLIVDDDELICHVADEILGKSFHVDACGNGAQAAKTAARIHPELILLDINLGDRTGFDVLRELREDPETDTIPVIFLTGESDEKAEIEGFRSGASDFVRKPFTPEVLVQRTGRVIALDRLQRSLQGEVKRQTHRAERLTKEMMLALSKTVDAKDHYTNGHSERVAAYSAEIARRMGKSLHEQEQIYEMGLLHDVGKIGVPAEIINKTSRLTDEEFEIIQRHTVIGSEILRLISEMPELSNGARSHHERYDGTGYPDALKGEQIPEAARIICVADCYDAMTSTRTYSTPRPQASVRAELERCAGTQFDPHIVQVMIRMIDEDTSYTMTEKDADIHIWRGSDRLWTIAETAPLELPEGVDSSLAPPGDDARESDDETQEPEDDAALPDWLGGVEGLDTEHGLLHCGTVETYLDTLTIYAKSVEENASEIERFWEAGDIPDVTVKVHALKSTSRAVGAENLGALAERLEHAGKAGDTQLLSAGLGELLSGFRALGKALAPLYAAQRADEEELPLIPEQKLREIYAAVRLSADNMDSEGAELLFRHLDGFRLPDGERERVEKLRHAVTEFDWDQIEDILK